MLSYMCKNIQVLVSAITQGTFKEIFLLSGFFQFSPSFCRKPFVKLVHSTLYYGYFY